MESKIVTNAKTGKILLQWASDSTEISIKMYIRYQAVSLYTMIVAFSFIEL